MDQREDKMQLSVERGRSMRYRTSTIITDILSRKRIKSSCAMSLAKIRESKQTAK
jgi:hypothetical protein